MILWLACASPDEELPELHVVVQSEELLGALSPKLRRFEEVLLRGQPFSSQPELFAGEVTVTDLEAAGSEVLLPMQGVSEVDLEEGSPAPAERFLGELLEGRRVERAEVKLRGVHYTDAARSRMEGTLKLDLVASGEEILWLHGKLSSDWTLGEEGWRINAVRPNHVEAVTAPAPLFREALDELVPDSDLRTSLRASTHDQHVITYLREGRQATAQFELESFDRHPAVSVVDLEGDGQDEIYVVSRWERAVLLKSGSEGWRDVAPELGLDLEGPLSAALFEDFDRDGHLDLFVARHLDPSLILWGGAEGFTREDLGPALATSAAAADLDGDGLSEIYVATYAASLIERVFELGEISVDEPAALFAHFLPRELAEELVARVERQTQVYLDRAGPPDVLLRNLGGRRFAEELQDDWRNTYQASFADLDDDGDPDLYLAHDFAPNQLLENREGRLVDVTGVTGTADFGFGMGISFADVDEDGREDVYVSNMYSTAGTRITAQLPELDERMAKGASGNSLLLNRGLGAAWERSAAPVQSAGWSWGGQLVDLDLDGQQDLYVPNGYYTAPAEVAIDHDT